MYNTERRIIFTMDRLERWRTVKTEALDGFLYIETGYTENNIPPSDKEKWKEYTPDIKLCKKEKHFWFHKKFTTPRVKDGQEINFRLYTGLEGQWSAQNPQVLVFLNGEIVQGMDTNHTEVLLCGETDYDMYLYLYSGSFDNPFEFKPSLVWTDKEIEGLYYDVNVAYRTAQCLETYEESYSIITRELNAASLILDTREIYSDEFNESIKKARKYLKENLYGKDYALCDGIVHCIGHTHIDVAWLWTLAQTREKAQRSFATVLKLMEQYPEYKFMSSQPQLYKYVKEAAPELYEKIKEKVKEGRWEVEGAMWLEADCNLTSGESLVRQILFGKRFMKEEFGVDSHILWLPDVFGYSAALPQILNKCGVDTFVTSKISWSEFNTMPYDMFIWQGIDGSEVFTYFLTAQEHRKSEGPDRYTTYVAEINPKYVIGTSKRNQQKEYSPDTIITFGWGDGGGGPTKEMLENQRRLAQGLPGTLKTEITFASDFIEKTKRNFEESTKALNSTPKWIGELYLETHRGTYTTVTEIKKNNRTSEQLLQTTEGISVIASETLGAKYPQKGINDMWELLLLNQFHDILPGSSIDEVYDESNIQYGHIKEFGEGIVKANLMLLAENIKTDGGIMVYNPNPFVLSDVVETESGQIYAKDIPSMGWKIIKPEKCDLNVKAEDNCIENKFYKICMKDGRIASIYDKTEERELVEKGKNIGLRIYEDYPSGSDAWNVDESHLEKYWEIDDITGVEAIIEEKRAGVKISGKFGKSTFVQNVYLYDELKRIDFETEVDWQEEHMLLKAVFPLNLHTTEASYETQFGYLKRTNNRNTSWDFAKFEVCAQRWADMSEDNYGVTLINDSKYGHSAYENELYLTLLKSAERPSKYRDKGKQSFKYALCPHKGTLSQSGATAMAMSYNRPLRAEIIKENPIGYLPEKFSLVSCNSNNVIIDTVKKAEDNNSTIIRLYQSMNITENTVLSFGKNIKSVKLCDMLENEINSLEFTDNTLKLAVKPFEIITMSVEFI